MGRTSLRWTFVTVCGALALYVTMAYVVLPLVWLEDERGTAQQAMLTRTSDDIPGDPINIGFEGTSGSIMRAFHAAGWYPADPVTLRSAISIGASVILDRPYDEAPVSSLFYMGRRQDLAFEKTVGGSASRRHHTRLWKVRAADAGERPLWYGTATFDRRVELSRDTAQITHGISADIDVERDSLVADIQATGLVSSRFEIEGIGPTDSGRNGEGDIYKTDGQAIVLVLAD